MSRAQNRLCPSLPIHTLHPLTYFGWVVGETLGSSLHVKCLSSVSSVGLLSAVRVPGGGSTIRVAVEAIHHRLIIILTVRVCEVWGCVMVSIRTFPQRGVQRRVNQISTEAPSSLPGNRPCWTAPRWTCCTHTNTHSHTPHITYGDSLSVSTKVRENIEIGGVEYFTVGQLLHTTNKTISSVEVFSRWS